MSTMHQSRREIDAQRSGGTRLRDLWVRARRRQTQFSLVSSAIAAALAVTLIVDYFVGHEHIRRDILALWIASYVALTILPIALGRRYPMWAGLLFVAYLSYWTASNLMRSNHPHMELNALLEVPMVALYLGWFYRPWIARVGMSVHLAVMVAAVFIRTSTGEHEFSTDLAVLYAVLIAVFCLETATYIRRSGERAAGRDHATGVFNRRGLAVHSERIFERAGRTGEPVVLAAVDFDDFKAVNDAGGHAEGDRALRTCSAAWRAGLGAHDLVARTGGDEFVLVIHGDEASAHERLRRLKSEAEFSWSWGLTRYTKGDTLESMMLRADRELYVRKHRHR